MMQGRADVQHHEGHKDEPSVEMQRLGDFGNRFVARQQRMQPDGPNPSIGKPPIVTRTYPVTVMKKTIA